MPIVGPVYQPTTYNVSYEQQTEWPHQSRRNKFLGFFDIRNNKECSSVLYILFHIIGIILGCLLIYYACTIIKEGDSNTLIVVTWIMICILYSTLYVMVAVAWYLMDIKHHFTWPNFIRKQGLARQMTTQSRNGQVL